MFDQTVLHIIDIDNEITSLVYGNFNEKEIWEVPHMYEYEKHDKSKSYHTAYLAICFVLSRFSLQHNKDALI